MELEHSAMSFATSPVSALFLGMRLLYILSSVLISLFFKPDVLPNTDGIIILRIMRVKSQELG